MAQAIKPWLHDKEYCCFFVFLHSSHCQHVYYITQKDSTIAKWDAGWRLHPVFFFWCKYQV